MSVSYTLAKLTKLTVSPAEERNETDLRENLRQDREERRINDMPDDDPNKEAARKAEDLRRAEYERQKQSNRRNAQVRQV